jgi:uncharacterized membrane protein YeiH
MTVPSPNAFSFALEHFGVAVSAGAGAVAARGRRVDLFGVMVLALVTALGGGTIRDLCLGAVPVFWIEDPFYVATAVCAGLATFLLARRREPPMNLLEIADAFGLAFFTMVGTRKSLGYDSGVVAAIALGTVTGVAGGIVRDVLLNELPLVFRKEIRLYATAAMLGAGVYVGLLRLHLPEPWPILAGMLTTLGVRLAAIRWDWSLPVFEAAQPTPPPPARPGD